MSEITLTSENFEQEVKQSSIPVLVDFWANWCGPCKMVAPVIEKIASTYEGRLKVGKINVDEQQQLSAAYSVMSIPTIIIFKNGEAAATTVGYQNEKALTKWIDENI